MSDHDLTPAQSRQALWDQRHAAQEPIESSEPDPTLVDEIGSLRPGRALDLGAGDGRNATWLARQGWQVTAVDFSGVAIERGRARAEAGGLEVDWQLADLLEWTPEARAYDLVTLFFIHLPREERRAVYARAANAVAIGGTLLVVAHDRTNLANGVGGPQDPDVLVSPAEIAAELTGYRVERAETMRRRAPDGRGPIDAIVRAVRVASVHV
ncbi:MAG: class I SAM-dependent methyltransferase [Candidatus Limnocylindrales bacterium]|nr:class I SAM-dependent methyltransferase [Candidatus Limnocylindrales bacterium]